MKIKKLNDLEFSWVVLGIIILFAVYFCSSCAPKASIRYVRAMQEYTEKRMDILDNRITCNELEILLLKIPEHKADTSRTRVYYYYSPITQDCTVVTIYDLGER